VQVAYAITHFTYETTVCTPHAALSGSCQDVAQHDRSSWSETVACSLTGAWRAEASAVYASKTGVLQTGGRKRERFPTGWRGQQIAPWARTAVHTVSIADLHGSSFVAPNSYTSPGKGSAETLQVKQQVTHALHAVTETHCDDLQIQRGKLTT